MKRILVADDKQEVLDSLKEMLLPYYDVNTAMSGFEVLQLCSKIHYDCIIIDVNFEYGISGLQVATILRSQDKKIRILIFSAIDYSQSVRQHAVNIGATFCEKPLSLDQIHKILGD